MSPSFVERQILKGFENETDSYAARYGSKLDRQQSRRHDPFVFVCHDARFWESFSVACGKGVRQKREIVVLCDPFL